MPSLCPTCYTARQGDGDSCDACTEIATLVEILMVQAELDGATWEVSRG